MLNTSTSALVLRSRSYRERDRWVTLLTPDFGRLSVLAKGVRAITSKRSAFLLPGSIIKCAWIAKGETRVLTEVANGHHYQATDITWADVSPETGTETPSQPSLERLRDLSAVLELIHHISLEEIDQSDLFHAACQLVRYIQQEQNYHRGLVREQLRSMAQLQGIEAEESSDPARSIIDLVEEAVGRKIQSFVYYA
jgi:recombinational DNA repair protein (RecF pathway)